MNLNNIEVQRVIMHTVHQKEMGQDSARADLSNNLIDVDENVIDIIKQRLVNAAGKDSRAFELEISDSQSGSFYSTASALIQATDEEFISGTQDLAELLASSQRVRSIPGGYLIIIEAKISSDKSTIIAIKAEPHEALRLDGSSRIKLLERVFLSPSQKLYKIGILYQKDPSTDNPNLQFGALLFDDQFRQDGHPAEYFYRDFLGLSTSNNSKIQTLQFYRKSESFILENVAGLEVKSELLSSLKVFTSNNVNDVLRPLDFANQFLSGDIKDHYLSEVVDSLPSSFVRDPILVKTKLSKRKIFFPNKINLVGFENNFDDNVKIITSQNDLSNLTTESDEYSILVVKGKPFTENE